jgi:RNA polymerase sigma-70 factor, ECF subfamily
MMTCFEFAKEWEKSEGYLRILIGAMIFNPQEREDILQDTALSAWKKAPAFNPALASFKTWISGFARIECLNHLRSRKSEKVLFDDELLDSLETACAQEEEMEEEDSLQEHLAECIKKLPKDKSDIIRMKYQGRMPLADIAAKMGTTEAAIKERLYRIKKELKGMIEKSLRAKHQ